MHEYFKQQTDEIADEKALIGIRKEHFKIENEYLLTAAQNHAIGIIISKRKLIVRNRIANVGYVVIEMKRLII